MYQNYFVSEIVVKFIGSHKILCYSQFKLLHTIDYEVNIYLNVWF